MPTLTVWDGVADCGDGRDRRVMVVYSDAQPTLVHRPWIVPDHALLHQRELGSEFGLLSVLLAVADYASDESGDFGAIQANWSALAAAVGIHRTSLKRNLKDLAAAGYLALDVTATSRQTGIRLVPVNRKTGDRVWTPQPDWSMRCLRSVTPSRKVYNVSMNENRTLEFVRATDSDQSLPEHNAPIVDLTENIRLAVELSEVLPGVLDAKCSAYIKEGSKTLRNGKNEVQEHGPDQNAPLKQPEHNAPFPLQQPNRVLEDPLGLLDLAATRQTAAGVAGERATAPAPIQNAAHPQTTGQAATFTPVPTIRLFRPEDYDPATWAHFVGRGGRLDETSRRALSAARASLPGLWELYTGLPFCVGDLGPLTECLALTSPTYWASALKACLKWPPEQPGKYLAERGVAQVLAFIQKAPAFLPKGKRQPKADRLQSGFDEDTARRSRERAGQQPAPEARK